MSAVLDKTHKNIEKGYDCAQSVVCSFCEQVGADEEILFKIAEGFGLGLGDMQDCGAVTGMTMIAGLTNSDGDLDEPGTVKETLNISKGMLEEFERKNGSIICRELKGIDTGTPLRSCRGCIEDAVSIVQKTLFE